MKIVYGKRFDESGVPQKKTVADCERGPEAATFTAVPQDGVICATLLLTFAYEFFFGSFYFENGRKRKLLVGCLVLTDLTH